MSRSECSRSDGRIGWLNEANKAVPPGEDCGYAAFIETVDAIAMGRHTFEQVLTFAPWPYGEIPVHVLSRQMKQFPEGTPRSVSLVNAAPDELVVQAAARGHSRLYVNGGLTIQRFLAVGHIEELTVTVVPVLLGQGRSLFGALPRDVQLRHVSTQVYPFGFVQSQYAVPNDT